MSASIVVVPEVGKITVVKSKASRSLRLSVKPNNIRLSVPPWTSQRTIQQFIASNIDWLKRQQPTQQTALLRSGDKIGKLHTVLFKKITPNKMPDVRVTNSQIIVGLDSNETNDNPAVQNRAHRGAVRALRKEAAQILPLRLRLTAERHGLVFKSVAIKQLTGRWGSCDNQKNIVLNLYLIQLPWELIDYVIVHELAHTKHMNHSAAFWDFCCELLPASKDLRRRLKNIPPAVTPQNARA